MTISSHIISDQAGVSFLPKLNEHLQALYGKPRSADGARPAWLPAGADWIYEVSATLWRLYQFDGVHDILKGAINPSTGAWMPVGEGRSVIAITADAMLGATHKNALLVVDASGGAVTLTLPVIADVGEPWNVEVQKADASPNLVNVVPQGTDTRDGVTDALVLAAKGDTACISADIDTSPDNWVSVANNAGTSDATPIGTVTWFAGRWPPNGWFVLDGAQLNRATHPDLWAHVQASGISVSEANWQADPMQRGRFSRGDEATTFRLPDLVSYESFIRATDPDSGFVGYRQSDAIRNITGAFHAYNDLAAEVAGAFTAIKVDDLGPGSGGTDTIKYMFDASRIVPTADENRPKSTRYIPIIKAYNTVTNQAQVEMGQVVQDVAANAAAIGNLQTNAYDGTVAVKSTRATDGTWGVVGLTPYKPVYIGLGSDTASSLYAYFYVSAGSPVGQTNGAGLFALQASSAAASDRTPPSCIIIPTVASLTLQITALSANTTIYAYQ